MAIQLKYVTVYNLEGGQIIWCLIGIHDCEKCNHFNKIFYAFPCHSNTRMKEFK